MASSSLSDLEKKYNFHHVSTSVPINIPEDPRLLHDYKLEGHLPFGPPVIHADPDRTTHLYEKSPLYTDNLQNFQNASFFRIDGNRIVPVINGQEVNLDIEMEE